MNEFVIVKFPTRRAVNVDGGPLRTTNVKLVVDTGTHTFDLGRPLDYAPASITLPVMGTSRLNPLTVTFAPIAVPVLGLAPAITVAAATPKKTAKPARKPTKKAAKKSAKKSPRKAVKKAARSAKKASRRDTRVSDDE